MAAEKLTERVTTALRDEPKRYPFMEQDALNATLRGRFAPLSPRYNFMGDFFLLDLERRIEPIVLHFVNAPKPWESRRVARRSPIRRELPRLVRGFPWPEWGKAPGGPAWRRSRPPLTRVRQDFAMRLSLFLERTSFLDK